MKRWKSGPFRAALKVGFDNRALAPEGAKEAAREIGRLDYGLGRIAGPNLRHPRRRRNRDRRDDYPPSGAHGKDRTWH
jgi:hypothetical protein